MFNYASQQAGSVLDNASILVLSLETSAVKYYASFIAHHPNHLKAQKQVIQEGQLSQTESAHLTWLYRMVAVQKAFQSETV